MPADPCGTDTVCPHPIELEATTVPTHNAQLAALIDPVVTGSGLVLEAVVVTTVGRRRLVKVVVDLPQDETGSVDLDRVAAVSRAVGDTLDGTEEVGPGEYSLEVSTPGVDRPLTERRHWLRARTRLVRAERDGAGPVTGRLSEVTDAGPVLLVDGAAVTLAWATLVKGVVEVEFSRPDPDRKKPAWATADDDADETDDPDDADETDADETDETDERGEA